MIRIYPTNYNEKERNAIQDLFLEMEMMFTECYCPYAKDDSTECSKCDYKRLCKAVADIATFAERITQ